MTTQAMTPPKSTKNRKPWWKRYLLANESVLLGILVLALIIILTIVVPTARQSRIYFDLLREISPNLVAAVGVALLMLAGEFDLSIGAMLALTGVVTVTAFNVTGNMWIGILAGLLTGPIIGSINGYLVTRQKHAFADDDAGHDVRAARVSLRVYQEDPDRRRARFRRLRAALSGFHRADSGARAAGAWC